MGWGRRGRSGRYSESYWPRYVSAGERRVKAQKEMEKLRKKGKEIQPVVLDGNAITRSFWGKAWCRHLESFSDYSNRLPRGRSYVRNGSVCHLEIRPGVIEAHVSGSSLYTVTIRVKKLPERDWKAIKEKCSGQIGSMLELLQGKFSDKVMAIVADRKTGLFPQPGEMELHCTCPDWANMCKHVAAVLYGVASRLDSQPELLFLLREVNAEELIFANVALPSAPAHADVLAGDQLGAIFGIDLDAEGEAEAATSAPKDPAVAARPEKKAKPMKPPKKRRGSKPAAEKGAKAAPPATPPAARGKGAPPTAAHVTRGKAVPPKVRVGVVSRAAQPAKATRLREFAKAVRKEASDAAAPEFQANGTFIAALRARLGLTAGQFARKIGVTTATVHRWEETAGPLRLQSRPLKALRKLNGEPPGEN